MKRKTKVFIGLASAVVIICGGLFGAGMYFYNVAVVPAPKSFLSKTEPIKPGNSRYPAYKWYQGADKQHWFEMSATRHLKLDANYISADKATKKTIIIAHGFMSNKNRMFDYAYLFHNLGYNVLLPDARGHGEVKETISAMAGRIAWTTLNGSKRSSTTPVKSLKLRFLEPVWVVRRR